MLFIISSPSGAGKSTLCNYLLEKFPDSLSETISVTTRKKRFNEADGREYYFKSREEYRNLLDTKSFLEHAEFCGNYYGTLKSEISRIINSGKEAVLLDIEYKGKNQITQHKDLDVVTVFIYPPSMEILEQRLRNRGTESQVDLDKRLTTAKTELLHANEYDYIIINDQLDLAKESLSSVYLAEIIKRRKSKYLKLLNQG